MSVYEAARWTVNSEPFVCACVCVHVCVCVCLCVCMCVREFYNGKYFAVELQK